MQHNRPRGCVRFRTYFGPGERCTWAKCFSSGGVAMRASEHPVWPAEVCRLHSRYGTVCLTYNSQRSEGLAKHRFNKFENDPEKFAPDRRYTGCLVFVGTS